MAEKVKVIDIDTGKSAKTLKELRTEIKNLRAELDNCEIGSEQFVDTLNELTEAQDELKTATKKSSEALEGSYDALVKKMGELKKQWRATADEMERSDLSGKIAEINQQLKDMDADIGNYQRNVGNYGSAFDDLSIKFEDGVAKFERMNKVTREAVGSFDAVEGGLKAMGVESEVVSSCCERLNGVMQMTQGFEAIKEGVVAFKALTVATEAQTVAQNTATAATNGFKKALIATGIGAIIVLIGTLIAYWEELTEALGFAKKEQEEVNKAIEESVEREKERKREVNSSVGSILGKYKLLQRQWQELSDVQEKNDWIKQNASAFDELGLSINDVNTAQSVFITNSEAVIKAIKDQARANAMAKLYEDAIAQQYTAQQELNDAKITAESKYYSGYNPTDEEAEKAGLTDYDYESGVIEENPLIYQLFGADKYEYNATSENVDYGGARKLQDVYTRPFQQSVDAINGEVAKLEEAFVEAEKTAAESAAAVQQLGINYTGSGSGSSDSSSSEKSPEEIAAEQRAERIREINQRLYEFNLNTRNKELAEAERIYNEELALLEGNETAKALLKEEYDAKVAEINQKYDDAEAARLAQQREETLASLDLTLAGIDERLNNQTRSIEIGFEAERLQLESEDVIGAIDLEIQKTLELQAIKTAAFDEEMAQIKAVMDQNLLSAEQQQQLADEYKRLQEEKRLAVAEATNQITSLNQQLIDNEIANNQKLAKNISSTFTSALSGVQSVLQAVQSNIDTSNRDGFEKNKKLQIANATIGMLVGITNAVAGLFTTKSGPWDIALAAIQAAAIATTGGIQIAQIKKQKYDGSGGGDTGNLNPSVNTAALMSSPVNYMTEIKGATAEEDIADTRVYVVESDISDTIRKVEVAEEESTY